MIYQARRFHYVKRLTTLDENRKNMQRSKTNEQLHDERSLLYLMGDLYIVDDVIKELQSADNVR